MRSPPRLGTKRLRRLGLGAALLLGVALQAPSARAQLALEAGLGFTSGPGTAALVSVALPYALSDSLAVGPLLQLAVGDDDRVIVAPTLDLRVGTALSNLVESDDPFWEALRPSFHAGVGFAYLERERPGDDDDIGFLFNLGFGLDYLVNERLALGSRMTFNVMPGEVLNEDFFFSWQLLHLRVRF